jgi:aconitate hydratase
VGKSITRKIIESHIVEGEWNPGAPIGIRIDQTLTQDATGTMAFLQYEALGLDKVKTDVSVSYVDHNTLQDGFENADDHKYLQTVAAKFGVIYSRAGNGICHQVHLERFGLPGKTLLGSDSHTPTGGGIGMISIGAGGLDVALAMAGQPFYLTCPNVVKVNLTGELPDWVSAKDVILKLLEIMTTKGNVGSIVEYGGPGVATLDVPQRATITNMGAELGVTTSVFPSDERTKAFLDAQGRGDGWVELIADDDAAYDKVIDIDLGTLEPRVAKPHSPDNIALVSDLAGMAVDQVCIGSCTNASYTDLVTVGNILEGQTVHPTTSLVVSPGSRQVYQMIVKDGTFDKLLAAGARIVEPCCGFCIGVGQAPKDQAVSVRTNNRNFHGRSGTKTAGIYLVSPETAAACAIKGEMTDPRTLGMKYKRVTMPDKFFVDDSMFIYPPKDGKSIEIYRGPNIGEPPKNVMLPENLIGEVGLKVGDKITTDHIMPAGPRLKFRSNTEKYSCFVFEGVDPEFSERARMNRDAGKATFIVGGASYGQGSSREHAALCPMHLGVKGVIAKSLERIHTANLINFGIIPLTFENDADYEKIEAGDDVRIEQVRELLAEGKPLVLKDETKGIEVPLKYDLTSRQREIILAGGLLNLHGKS